MNILMMTNTFTPHVGGVARSIEQFSAQYRAWGHQVLVVAPEFDDIPAYEDQVIRIPAFRNFNHTDFSVVKPVPHFLLDTVEDFKPDIIHSHHPFLIGNMALRIAHVLEVPIVFTHHTKYEDYTHNMPVDNEGIKNFAINLATNYANTCDYIFAPSKSMEEIIVDRGVVTPIDVVPTGVNTELFANGRGAEVRKSSGIPEDAFVVGHLGRISEEKNIEFLIRSVIRFLKNPEAPTNSRFLIAGTGPKLSTVDRLFAKAGLTDRLHKLGMVDKSAVPDAFHAMDVFAFSSLSETQGMVITEAMTTGTPVIALDAPGVRDVLNDGENGCLLMKQDETLFENALMRFCKQTPVQVETMRLSALTTADKYSMASTAATALDGYKQAIANSARHRPAEFQQFVKALHFFESEWMLIKNTLKAFAVSLV